ncbi:hypothetical protein B0H63DRAFT_519723 [Podospora didyma]|uniref:Uncharacterized protein n=1 Tax=Podospora didyma TaxID=330526 RepID=A0AAE0U4P1_9PEZI|nr:hypothetical protein B0H63DRAFT_519723 [Podospora didyma]
MAATYDTGLEAAPQNFPEVAHPPPHHQEYAQNGYQQPYNHHYYDVPKPEVYGQVAPSSFGGQTVASPFSSHAQTATAQNPSKSRTICGCSLLVFILSCIIALLSAACIGLAAGTGIESQRANDATGKFATLSASMAAIAAATPTTTTTGGGCVATSTAAIDDNCASDPGGVNKTVYRAFSILSNASFKRYCNLDAPNPPLLSLFTSDFKTCMDACAAYSKYEPGFFGSNVNTTCSAVSFIPAWTNKTTALLGTAPGNCYLKPGPQSEGNLTTPNIGVSVHAALLLADGS